MFGTNKKKIALYVGYAVILCVSLIGYEGMGLTKDCDIEHRLTYPFYHQNIFHAIVNLWVMHQCIMFKPCGWLNMVVFYAIAISYNLPSSLPIIGLSGMAYAYMGFIAPLVANKTRYHITILAYVLLGIFIPCMAVGIHIYCYVLGLVWGYLNAQICDE